MLRSRKLSGRYGPSETAGGSPTAGCLFMLPNPPTGSKYMSVHNPESFVHRLTDSWVHLDRIDLFQLVNKLLYFDVFVSGAEYVHDIFTPKPFSGIYTRLF